MVYGAFGGGCGRLTESSSFPSPVSAAVVTTINICASHTIGKSYRNAYLPHASVAFRDAADSIFLLRSEQ